jgi:hypothetical protein
VTNAQIARKTTFDRRSQQNQEPVKMHGPFSTGNIHPHAVYERRYPEHQREVSDPAVPGPEKLLADFRSLSAVSLTRAYFEISIGSR